MVRFKTAVDTSEVRQLERDLGKFRDKAMPHAIKNTLNSAAFKTRELAMQNIESKMILRNKWTLRSVRVNKAGGLNVRRMIAAVGSVAPYMETQEFGGTKTAKGSKGVPIATSVAAGQGMGARPRTRLPRRPNQIGSIRLSHARLRGASRKQRNLVAIRSASESGRKFVYLKLKRSEGIFKVTGGKKRPKIKMLWDMSRKSVPIRPNPWLKPAFDEAAGQLARLHLKSLQFQVKRLGLFK